MKTETIIVKNITQGTLTNVDGLKLKLAIDAALVKDNIVTLSFSGISSISSSFLNSSLGDIIENYNISILKNRIKITNYTPNLALIIKKYIANLEHTEVN